MVINHCRCSCSAHLDSSLFYSLEEKRITLQCTVDLGLDPRLQKSFIYSRGTLFYRNIPICLLAKIYKNQIQMGLSDLSYVAFHMPKTFLSRCLSKLMLPSGNEHEFTSK
jgi:hypothetical protein